MLPSNGLSAVVRSAGRVAVARQTPLINVALARHSSTDAHGSKHWSRERVVSVALVGALGVPMATGMTGLAVDLPLIALLQAHSVWGTQCVIDDYYAKVGFGETGRKVATFGFLGFHLTTLGAMVHLSVNDVGLTEGIKMFWHAL